MNNFGLYQKYLNKYTTDLSKKKPDEIRKELRHIESLNIPNYEKLLVRGTLYKKLNSSKRKQSGFGNVSPGSNMALATPQPAVTAAAATAAAQNFAAATAAAAVTAAASGVAPPGANIPGFIPAVSQPFQQPQQVRITQNGAVPATNYQQAAGAIYNAQNALQNATQQLQMMAGAQNISG